MASWQIPEIKAKIEEAGFSPAQFNVLKEALKGVRGYRSGKQISNFWEGITPDYMELKHEQKEGKYGPYTESYAVAKEEDDQ